MSKLVAAYDLGRNMEGLGYNVRYFQQFPWDPRARGGRAIYDCLRWIADDLILLLPDFPREAPSRQLFWVLEEFRADLTSGSLAREGGTPQAPADEVLARLRRQAAHLSAAALRARPILFRWYQFGRAVGICYLELEGVNRTKVLASLPHLLQMAARLPDARAERVDVIRRLREQSVQAAKENPLRVLRKVLSGDVRGTVDVDGFNPMASVIREVERLDRRIRTELEREPDSPTLVVCSNPPGVSLNGRPYKASEHQVAMLTAIIDAEGKFVSGPQMMRRFPKLESANLSREIATLDEDVKCLVKTRKGPRGAGYCWIG